MCRTKTCLCFTIAMLVALLIQQPATVSAQRTAPRPSATARAASQGFKPSTRLRPSNVNRPSQSSASRSSGSGNGVARNNSSANRSSRSNSSRNYSGQNRSQQFNNRPYSSSRQLYGNNFGSAGFGNRTVFLGGGFNTPYYSPYLYGNTFGGFGGFGVPLYRPNYSTYGTYLNTGGPLSGFGAGPIDSSVAGQAFNRLGNGQPVVPNQQNPNTALELENLRLQLELEKAKRQLAERNQAPQAQVQQTLKPAIGTADNNDVVEQLGLAAIIETNELAEASQLKGERAFRSGNYGQAARFVDLATSLDEANGKLQLFATQAHFANGEYSEAFDSLQAASALLSPDDLAYVVDNFKLFYGQNDFVSQTRALSTYLQQSPSDADAWMLRGFQYGALGYPDAASKDFAKAASLGGDRKMIDMLQKRFVPAK